jgi:hypothetical protein
MSLQALSDYVVYSKYSHYLPEKKRRETWEEITDRVFGMHERRFNKQLSENEEFKKDFEFAKQMVKKKRVLGSQRALQFGGKWIEKHELKMFNCATTHIDRPRVFQEVMYTLLCGTGMGFSVQKQHVKRLPKLVSPTKGKKVFKISDDIEGWADAVGVISCSFLDSDHEFKEYVGYDVEFDYSEIRPEGSLIAGQFKAPGHVGLANSLEKIRKLVKERIESADFNEGEFAGKLKPINAYDIVCYASDGVLSGGIRRSATLTLFSVDDEEMANAKIGDWYITNAQRARSNNSAALLKGKTTKEQFGKLMESTRRFGEPGFVWLENLDIIYNPCCLSGDTAVTCENENIYIKDIVERFSYDKNIKVLTLNEKNGKQEFKKVVAAALTRKNAEVVKVFFRIKDHEDFEFFVTCTPDHKFFVNGEYVEAQYLESKRGYDCDNQVGHLWFNRVEKQLKTQDVYDIEVEDNHNFYANGVLVHNCEIGMIPSFNGETGVQVCNLTEINGKFCDTEEKFLECCRASAIIGTMQASYTNFKYLTDVSKQICDKEALLGCSITGVMDNPDILLNVEIQQKGAKLVLEINEKIAKIIGVNKTARATCIKPAGSTSCVLKTSSGIHLHHSKRYIRRAQANRNEFPLQYFVEHNPDAVEKSVWSANDTDYSISFLCEVPKGAKLKNELSAIEFLEQVKTTQNNWVEYGTRPELGTDPTMRHNVSVTVVVKNEQEWLDVEKYIFDNQQNFAGISLINGSGDLDYAQAPFCGVLTPEELVKEYGDGSILGSGLVVDGLTAFDNNLWNACSAALGHIKIAETNEPTPPIKPIRKNFKNEKSFSNALANYAIELNLFYQEMGEFKQNELKLDWIRRANQFAVRYFDGNLTKTTHCLKHLSLWHTWLNLKRTYKEVDWSKAVEETEDHVGADTLGASACSGGSCEIR